MDCEKHRNLPECAKNWIEDAENCWNHLWNLCRHDPEQAWEIIQAVYEEQPGARVLHRLAAGPLEDLLTEHGSKFIERVINLAAHDQGFRGVLRMVRNRGMPEETWEKIQRAVAGS